MSDNFQQQDASMEEILGSIRKILSSDDDVKRTYPKKIDDSTPIELTDVAEVEEPEINQSMSEVANHKEEPVKSTFEDHTQEPQQPWEKVTEETVAKSEDFKPNTRLVSQAMMAASNAALSELTEHVKEKPGTKTPSTNTSIEELLKSMLSPLLKDWLEKNLPTVIEKVVREEIRAIVNTTSK